MRPSLTEPLLASDEPGPYRVVNPQGRTPMLFTCDHASHAVPQSLGGLGIEPRDLTRHIGWDPGAEEVTLRLSERFDAPAILSGYSRLVIDCNRRPGSATSIPEVSDRTIVPGNIGLGPADAERRVESLFRPYHQAIADALDTIEEKGRKPVYVAIHTFTPELAGFRRPWHFGVLWDDDPRFARPLIESLRRHPGLCIGDNQPYSGRDHFDFSQGHHATSRGLPTALVEIRSDLVRDDPGVARYADLLGAALQHVLATFGLQSEGNGC